MKHVRKSIVLLALVMGGNPALTQTGWQRQVSGTTNYLYWVHFPAPTTGWVVGQGGTILKTTNAGTTWFSQPSGTTEFLYSVFFISPDIGWTVGYNGVIRKTTNGGVTWSPQRIDSLNRLYSVVFTDINNGCIVGSNGIVLKTTNGGTNWRVCPSGTTNTLSDLSFPPSATGLLGYAVGGAASEGTILKTVDGGSTWTQQTSGTTNWLFGVHFTDLVNGHAVGFNGTIVATTNGGTIWSPQTSGTTNRLVATHFVNRDTGWAVGYSGTILRTSNGGTEWLPQANAVTQNLWGVHFTDAKNGWAAGWNGTILHTTNGGVSNSPPLPFHLLHPANGDTMTVMRSIRFVWQRAIDPDRDSVRYSLLLSTNRGTAWREIGSTADTSLQVQNIGSLFDPGSYWWRVTASDGANTTSSLDQFTFTVRSSPEAGPFTFTLVESDGNVWTLEVMRDSLWRYFRIPLSAFGSGGGFLNTPVTKIVLRPVGGERIGNRRIEVVDWIDHLVIAGILIDDFDDGQYSDWQMMLATNGSYLLVQAESPGPDGSPRSLRLTHGNDLEGSFIGWLEKPLGPGIPMSPTDTLQVWLRGATYVLDDIGRPPSEMPEAFALYQNFPNPFNPATTINYQLPVSSHVTLRVFDILGREVATLVDELQDAGYQSVQWDAASFTTGLYFYRLQAGNFTDSQRMLLLK